MYICFRQERAHKVFSYISVLHKEKNIEPVYLNLCSPKYKKPTEYVCSSVELCIYFVALLHFALKFLSPS